MTNTHNISSISFENNKIILQIDGELISLPIDKVSKRLECASDLERNLFNISPSGYGIHWPLIDEDISIDALLRSL